MIGKGRPYLRLISSRASFIGLLDIWMIPRKGTFSSSVISIAPATASAQRNSARIAVALCGANRPKLKKRRLSQNTTNTSNGIAIPVVVCSAKSHRAPVIALTSCSACDRTSAG
jgi:hypothetical protein